MKKISHTPNLRSAVQLDNFTSLLKGISHLINDHILINVCYLVRGISHLIKHDVSLFTTEKVFD